MFALMKATKLAFHSNQPPPLPPNLPPLQLLKFQAYL